MEPSPTIARLGMPGPGGTKWRVAGGGGVASRNPYPGGGGGGPGGPFSGAGNGGNGDNAAGDAIANTGSGGGGGGYPFLKSSRKCW